MELMREAEVNAFSFGSVQLQGVFAHPYLYLLQAGVHLSDRGGGSGGGHDLDVKLCVISIAVELYPMPSDDMTEGVKPVKGGARDTSVAFQDNERGCGGQQCQMQQRG